MKIDGKTAVAAASALALASMGAAPLTAIAAPAAPADDIAAVAAAEGAQARAGAKAERVTGSFAYTQDAVTSTAQVKDVFAKSAAVLCQALPTYGCTTCAKTLALTAPDAAMEATIAELAGQDAQGSALMACACATNAPGGGAVANAEAQGVAFRALAAIMGM